MGTYTNQAKLVYNGMTTTSNTAYGEVTDVLSVTKKAVYGGYSAGDKVTYLIVMTNSGSLPITKLTITDDMGDYLWAGKTLYPLTYIKGSVILYKNGVIQTAPTLEEGPPLIFKNISVPAKGNVTIVYQAQTTEWAPLGKTAAIHNTAVVTGGGLYRDIIAESRLAMEEKAMLTVIKSISPIPVAENTRVTYTFTIENNGTKAADSASKVTIEDIFDPKLSDLEVSFNKIKLTKDTDYTYDVNSGLFKVKENIITVPEAEYFQDNTGAWYVEPAVRVLIVTGII